jgi:hypothetical protein
MIQVSPCSFNCDPISNGVRLSGAKSRSSTSISMRPTYGTPKASSGQSQGAELLIRLFDGERRKV